MKTLRNPGAGGAPSVEGIVAHSSYSSGERLAASQG